MLDSLKIGSALALTLCLSACSQAADAPKIPDPAVDLKYPEGAATAEMVVSGGCFWCTEEVCQHVPGVKDVVSGYTGGSKEDANYKKVCTGTTGHAEAIKITYDPTKTTYGQLLKVFFAAAHDPTQLNKQGDDIGPQYRSAIFYADEEQKRVAEAYIKQLNDAKVFAKPIVTTLEPLKEFYVAEPEHQDYAKRNPKARYIEATVPQKMDKLKKLMMDEKETEKQAEKPAAEPKDTPKK